ncbi:MAG: hypothetical protein EA375_03220 [Acholeplasmataceae bacterium]|nr:MAG: hypothetical protein EA375_03220 [Acholeplasmataceae bacterium]
MFELMVGIIVISFWLGFIGGPLALFALRTYRVIQDRLVLKKAVFVLLVPCSIGYFLTYRDEQSRFTRLYAVVMTVAFVLIVIGGLLSIYMHLDLHFIY